MAHELAEEHCETIKRGAVAVRAGKAQGDLLDRDAGEEVEDDVEEPTVVWRARPSAARGQGTTCQSRGPLVRCRSSPKGWRRADARI